MLNRTHEGSQSDLAVLLSVLPPRIREALEGQGTEQLLEIVLDLGRVAEARYPGGAADLGRSVVSAADLAYVVERIGAFGDDNRAGIGRTLHRISAIRNRRGEVVGLTCRVGRAVRGTVALLRDVIEEGKSILILGRPGVGKTTLLREAARVLADELGKRVVVVDTSNEIAGDGDVPHPGIGRARRMQVARPAEQHRVMIEAVENHMPEVIVIDEIGTELEAAAARTIAERGVQLIGTAHGRTLENLLVNPTLSDLVGGIQSVTLGDEEAKRRGTQKTVLERKAPPTFDVLIEQLAYGEIIIHRDVAAAVDAMLRGHTVLAEQRTRDENDAVTKQMTQVATTERTDMRPELSARSGYGRGNGRQNGRAANGRGSRDDWKQRGLNDPRHMTDDGMVWQGMTQDMADDAEALMLAEPTGTTGSVSRVRQPARPRLRVYPFGVSRERLEESAKQMRINLDVTSNPAEADAVITSRTYFRRQQSQLPSDNVFVVETNTVGQMRKCLQRIVDLRDSENAVEARQHDHPTMLAIREAEDASIQLRNSGNGHVVLPPQNAYVRRMQHEVANRYNLESRSVGKDPYRRVQIMAR